MKQKRGPTNRFKWWKTAYRASNINEQSVQICGWILCNVT